MGQTVAQLLGGKRETPREETVGLADRIVYRTGLCALKLEAFAPGSECVGSSSENRW